jgi:hypothetical protein
MRKIRTGLIVAGGFVVGLGALLSTVGSTAGYEITKVIEVGPAAWVPFTGPLRWSPDGTMLAYFANNYLMISDTLGNSREVKSIDIGITPRRFEWVSNDKVAINLPKYELPDSTLYNTITLVDINTGQDQIVVSDQPGALKPVGGQTGRTFFEGPFLSLEGNAYYMIKTCTGRSKEIPLGRVSETVDEPHWFFPDKAPAMEDNHTTVWEMDGLYILNLDKSYSVKITHGTPGVDAPTAVSQDMSYVFRRGLLKRIPDSAQINVYDFAGARPSGTFGCGFLFVSFNPKTTEILFNQTCDGDYPSGGEFVVDRIGTFDYVTNEFTILDTLIGIEGCTAPVYAPDGRKVAFLDNDDYRAYIIYREEK